jgi:hypothetical protein
LDEVFGSDINANFRNEIVWSYRTGGAPKDYSLARKHDVILFYSKSNLLKINPMKERQYLDKPFMESKVDAHGRYYVDTVLRDSIEGVVSISDGDKIKEFNTRAVLNLSTERLDYPTQKPEGLISLLINLATKPGDLVFDCFMGSGTTQAAAYSLNRKFIGADINLVSIQTTTKRLNHLINKYQSKNGCGFEVYNVNNYELFNNPLEAKDILIEVFGIKRSQNTKLFDGELDGRNIKIMPINRITSKVDLNELIANLPYESYRKRQEESPNAPVDLITLICMGHEPDLLSEFKKQTSTYKIDIEILDILSDKKDLEFKREAKANIEIIDGKLIIQSFYPMNLLQKLSIQQENVGDYRQLVESIMIDWNYDGVALRPNVIDIPEKNTLVVGSYILPETTSRIRIKITDLISESLEIEVTNNG